MVRGAMGVVVLGAVLVLLAAPAFAVIPADTIQGRVNNYQRYDLDGNKVETCFCLRCSAEEQCDFGTYQESLTYVGGWGALFAMMSVVVWASFLVFRYCCNCCGGKEPSGTRLCCFVDPKISKFKGYRKSQVLIPKLLLLIIVIISFVLMILGFVFSGEAQDAKNSAMDSLQGIASDTNQLLVTAEVDVLAIAANNSIEAAQVAEIEAGFAAGLGGGANVVSRAQATDDELTQLEDYRQAFLILGLTFTVVLCVLTLVAIVRNMFKLSFNLGNAGFWIMAVCWVSFGFHTALVFLLADACEAIDDVNAAAVVPVNSSIGAILSCDDATTIDGFNQALNVTEELRRTLLGQGCDTFERGTVANQNGINIFLDNTDQLSRICVSTDELAVIPAAQNLNGEPCECENNLIRDEVNNAWMFCDPATCADGNTLYQRVYELILTTTLSNDCEVVAAAGQIALTDCPNDDNCVEDCKVASAEVTRLFTSAIELDTIIDDQLEPTAECDFLRTFIQQSETTVCEDYIQSADVATSASLGLSILLLIASPLLIVGLKRFNIQNFADGYIPRHRFGATAISPATI